MAREARNDEFTALADHISDRIIDVLNDELSKPGFSPAAALAGQCLGLLGFMRTAPPPYPRSFSRLEYAAQELCRELLEKGVTNTVPQPPRNRRL